jgi:hypothetical protein
MLPTVPRSKLGDAFADARATECAGDEVDQNLFHRRSPVELTDPKLSPRPIRAHPRPDCYPPSHRGMTHQRVVRALIDAPGADRCDNAKLGKLRPDRIDHFITCTPAWNGRPQVHVAPLAYDLQMLCLSCGGPLHSNQHLEVAT